MIQRIYHLTSRNKWNKIKNEGYLKPLTDPGLDNKDLSDQVRLIIQDTNYLVGIPPGYVKVWDEYRLLEEVERHAVYRAPCGPRPNRNDIVVLSVPILKTEDAFVREHKYPTGKWGDKFMPGAVMEVQFMHRSAGMSMASKEQIEFENKLWTEYYNSTIRLQDYHGQFEVPEVWLAQETPIDLISLSNP